MNDMLFDLFHRNTAKRMFRAMTSRDFFILFLKDLKQRKRVRWAIALFLFPFAYCIALIHPHHGFNLLVKIFLTELANFDRIVAKRLSKILLSALSHYYYSASPEFVHDPSSPDNPEAEYLVLKSYISNVEKGVISIHWRWQVDIFSRNYDIAQILSRYMVILGADCYGTEWTYPFMALMQSAKNANSAVFTAARDQLVQKRLSLMGFKTIPHGLSSDFINPDKFVFLGDRKKSIDVILVANWNFPIKRHYVLFKALEKITEQVNVALVGFSSVGYTIQDIRKLEACYDLKKHRIQYYENANSSLINTLFNKSKVSVITSLMEGGNRACFESFFANTPAIILAESAGIPKEYFNNKTGIICEESKLHDAIRYSLKHYADFAPRNWALSNISPKVTIKKINTFLKEFSLRQGMAWTKDLVGKQWVGQSFEYLDEILPYDFHKDYQFIGDCFKYTPQYFVNHDRKTKFASIFETSKKHYSPRGSKESL